MLTQAFPWTVVRSLSKGALTSRLETPCTASERPNSGTMDRGVLYLRSSGRLGTTNGHYVPTETTFPKRCIIDQQNQGETS